MAELWVMQMPAILFAAAALVASLSTMIQVLKGRAKIEAHSAKLDAIDKKVDGGMTNLQNALAEIAKTAQAQAATAKTVVVKDGQRATDGKREP